MSDPSSPILAFDYGAARIGVALGDPRTKLSFALKTLDSRRPNFLSEELSRLLLEWKPRLCIVGLSSSLQKDCQAFGSMLIEKFHQVVVYIEEDFSSTEAETHLKERGKSIGRHNKHLIDQQAAKVIMDSYFNQLLD